MSLLLNLLKSKQLPVPIRGILDVGSFHCDEIKIYSQVQTCQQIVWVEAIPSNVQAGRLKYPKEEILQGVITEHDDQDVEMIETNDQGRSSSLFELKLHKHHFPTVWETSRSVHKSIRLDSLLKKHKIIVSNLNFLHLDVQGAELNVLKSLQHEELSSIDYIQVHVFTQEVFVNSPLFPILESFLSPSHKRLQQKMNLSGSGDVFYIRNAIIISPPPPPPPTKIERKTGPNGQELIVLKAETNINILLTSLCVRRQDIYSTILPGLIEFPETLIRNLRQMEENLQLYGFSKQESLEFTIWKRTPSPAWTTHQGSTTSSILFLQRLFNSLKCIVLDNASQEDVPPLLPKSTECHVFQSQSTTGTVGGNIRWRRARLAMQRSCISGMSFVSLDEYCRDKGIWSIDYLHLARVSTIQNLLQIFTGAIGMLHHTRIVQWSIIITTATTKPSEWSEVLSFLVARGFRLFCGLCDTGILYPLDLQHQTILPDIWVALKQPCLI